MLAKMTKVTLTSKAVVVATSKAARRTRRTQRCPTGRTKRMTGCASASARCTFTHCCCVVVSSREAPLEAALSRVYSSISTPARRLFRFWFDLRSKLVG